jgi:hypothetical protein
MLDAPERIYPMTDQSTNPLEAQQGVFVTTAIAVWDTWAGRTGKLFSSLSDEQLLVEIAPGKNRLIYVFGHLIAVNDAMIPLLRLGEARYSHLTEIFVTSPDRAVTDLPPIAELRQNWNDLSERLTAYFKELSPAQWLERHGTVSEEDFAKEPYRNRLAILMSRTNHTSYHLGQLMLRGK